MQIKHITINRDDISKNNISDRKFNYSSVVNNSVNNTSDDIISSTVSVLFDIYQSIKEDSENEVTKTN
ncbi:MAG: hypothetical protein K2K89_04175 [Ruminococcus sp.]|nr:hypothetical protein [Ruminococcus sp.]MDE6788485.1 hypothetical protein [Ruminococcus sp.]